MILAMLMDQIWSIKRKGKVTGELKEKEGRERKVGRYVEMHVHKELRLS